MGDHLRKNPLPVAVRYAFFAALATAANLLVQWLLTGAGRAAFPEAAAVLAAFPDGTRPALLAWPPSAAAAVYWAALAAGTLAGFIVKYLLDKNFIFRFKAGSARAGAATVALYGLTAVITTLVFWGVQTAFTWLGESEVFKYLGGLCGLIPGYILKYLLDKRFVFRKKPAAEAPS